MDLTKRPDGLPRLNLHCAVCDGPVDGYTVTDIDSPTHTMSFNAFCHGDGVSWGIDDVKGFWEMMAAHRGEAAVPMVLFRPAPVDPPPRVEDTLL